MWNERKNNAKFSGHNVRPRTHNVRAHAIRSHQLVILRIWTHSEFGQTLQLVKHIIRLNSAFGQTLHNVKDCI